MKLTAPRAQADGSANDCSMGKKQHIKTITVIGFAIFMIAPFFPEQRQDQNIGKLF
jgi:hypothetical protein